LERPVEIELVTVTITICRPFLAQSFDEFQTQGVGGVLHGGGAGGGGVSTAHVCVGHPSRPRIDDLEDLVLVEPGRRVPNQWHHVEGALGESIDRDPQW
jgi:hypothetical protein